jgi:hypothetical protein
MSPGTHAVVLAAKDQDHLRDVSAYLANKLVKHHSVYENDPPYADQLMAIGVPPAPRDELRRLFSSLPLLR